MKACLNIKFGADTNKHINETLMKRDTRVLALVVFYELGNINPRKMFRVLSFLIHTIIDKYVCIDYLGTDKLKISDLNMVCTGLRNIMVWITTTYSELVF